ncbi:hypothetical protein KC318_g40 [Hortaea werneckii]|nr:hypothetical protein KC334_g37 [Hortaea werneckii]KAI7676770.1 hypothetical protein KC318_g40 [Hortaea werneckii]
MPKLLSRTNKLRRQITNEIEGCYMMVMMLIPNAIPGPRRGCQPVSRGVGYVPDDRDFPGRESERTNPRSISLRV